MQEKCGVQVNKAEGWKCVKWKLMTPAKVLGLWFKYVNISHLDDRVKVV